MLESAKSKSSLVPSRLEVFEINKLELWYQPVYQLKTGAVLHNEVLVRRRSDPNHLQLPQAFFPALEEAGMLPQVDQAVIRKAIELLVQYPDQYLSINLSGEGFRDTTVIEHLTTLVSQSGIDYKQLSFELDESAIAQDFAAAADVIRELKKLGCFVVIDNFASRDLTLPQCQELAVDLLKVDGDLIQRLKSDPSARALTKAIIEGVQHQTQLVAKFVADTVTLEIVRDLGFDCVQAYHLKHPASEPDWSELPKIAKSEVVAATKEKRPFPWQRLALGTAFVSVAAVALAVGLSSVGYRLRYLVVDGGLINSRVVRLRAPIAGNLKAFYAQPGSPVQAGQVLARIEHSTHTPKDEQALWQQQRQIQQLQGKVETNERELTTARQHLDFLKTRSQELDQKETDLRQVDTKIATAEVGRYEAAVVTARQEANAARTEYERYQKLLNEGAVKQQQVDQLRFAAEAAEARVNQAKADLKAAQTSLAASNQGVAMTNQQTLGARVVEQQSRLNQKVQEQDGTVRVLEAKLSTTQDELKRAQQQLEQLQVLYNKREELEVLAPASGVIYRSEREQGEQVTQAEPLLTVLDCNEIWVESIVSAKQASKIDLDQPVGVTLAGYSETLRGDIELVQPFSGIQSFDQPTQWMQVQALQPTIPSELLGQPLTRVTVRIPPPPRYTQSQNFCGVGQSAEVSFSKKGLGVFLPIAKK